MELLIVLALSLYGFARYSSNGVMAARKKIEPLRLAERRQRAAFAQQRHLARMKRRGGRPTIVEAISIRIAHRIANPPKRRHPAREAIWEWWADSWDYATDRRRRRHARAAAGQLGRQKAARAARAWIGQKWASRKTKSRGTGPHTSAGETDQPNPPKQDQGQGQEPDPQPVSAEAEVLPNDPANVADAEIIDAEIVDDPPAAKAEPAADGAAANDTPPTTSGGEPAPHPRADGESARPKASGAAPGGHHPHNAGGRMASVTPIRKELALMSSPSQHNVASGETLDPAAGRAFASGVGDVASRLVSEIEQSIASLSQRGVSGEPLAHLNQMQEAAQILASNSADAVSHFDRHLNTQDQVLSDQSLAGSVDGTYLGTRN